MLPEKPRAVFFGEAGISLSLSQACQPGARAAARLDIEEVP